MKRPIGIERLPAILAACAAVFLATAGGAGTAETPEAAVRFRQVARSKDVAAYARAALALRRWMMANDPHYPTYHFTGPESWINDPNGPIFYRGAYHLFYQFDPIVDGRRIVRCWGHAVSADLVHWQDWPVALWPDTDHDRQGVYSGNTLVDDQGRLCALYTGNVADHKEAYGILARSDDAGLTWRKQTVMHDRQRPNAESPVHWDGFTWKAGDQWRQLVGGTTGGNDRQGAAYLWTSPDLEHWTFQKNIAPSIRFGPFWELPYLVPLDGRHVLLVGQGNPYWIGTYDADSMRFTPDNPQPKQVDTGSYYSFNLNMVDNKGPGGSRRQLMHGWVTGPASPTKTVPYWEGAHSIPRVLRLKDGRLWQDPIPEIESLRAEHYHFTAATAAEGLKGVRGDALEILAVFEPGAAGRFGLKLRVSPDGKACTRVFFDARERKFGIEGSGVVAQDSFLPADRPVPLRAFIDRSIVEAFVNGAACTARTFPAADALGVELFTEGGPAQLKSLDVWRMKPMW